MLPIVTTDRQEQRCRPPTDSANVRRAEETPADRTVIFSGDALGVFLEQVAALAATRWSGRRGGESAHPDFR